MVCNGHSNVPNIVNIKGDDTFPGEIIHSNSYKNPK